MERVLTSNEAKILSILEYAIPIPTNGTCPSEKPIRNIFDDARSSI